MFANYRPGELTEHKKFTANMPDDLWSMILDYKGDRQYLWGTTLRPLFHEWGENGFSDRPYKRTSWAGHTALQVLIEVLAPCGLAYFDGGVRPIFYLVALAVGFSELYSLYRATADKVQTMSTEYAKIVVAGYLIPLGTYRLFTRRYFEALILLAYPVWVWISLKTAEEVRQMGRVSEVIDDNGRIIAFLVGIAAALTRPFFFVTKTRRTR